MSLIAREPTVTVDQLRRAVKAEPFRPFTICTADGSRYQVPHPDFITVPPTAQRTFVIVGPEDPEDYRILDLLLVTAIEYGNENRRQSA